MRPLLTIAVPTYNRPEALARLAKDFLISASGMDGVEVVVCDNSDDAAARSNQEVFAETDVRYCKNEKNLGFHGNLLRCIERASGQWLWIISDDDGVDQEAFSGFVQALKDGWAGDAQGVMLPYWVTGTGLNGAAKRILVNTSESWGGEGSLKELVRRAATVPFILFSSVVLRVDEERKKDIHSVFQHHQPNDFMQVMLFGHLLGWEASIRFWGCPLQEYRHAHEVCFPLRSLMVSMDRVLKYLEHEAGLEPELIARMRRKQYRGWAIWYARHRVGQVKIQEAEAAFGALLARSIRLGTPKALLLLLAARLLPRVMLKSLLLRVDS